MNDRNESEGSNDNATALKKVLIYVLLGASVNPKP